jgi:succinate-semialdehyde dehydrogenase/glutarate-semialdehyde dehydrogenase
MPIASINPTTGVTLRLFDPLAGHAAEEKLELAWTTFNQWRRTAFSLRREILLNAAEILETEKRAFGELMTLEMGKTLSSAIAEAEKCALGCRYYAENAEQQLAAEEIPTGPARSFVEFQPLGPILAVMPWNFPFWQVLRFAAPALMAGNVCLLKHASNVPQCALAIEDLLHRAGVPKGGFQTLLIEAAQVESLLNDDRIAAVTLTGSEPAGRAVASQAARQIKKAVLELGGSDPFIVMPSADLDAAIQTGIRARTINNGQSCIAAKRFFIHESIYPEFERRFVEGMKSLKVGDPMDDSTQIGPLATSNIRRELHDQVRRAIDSGAKLLTGGEPLNHPGNFYPPTVLAGLPRESPVFREELFGPVAMLFRVKDAAHAIEMANDSPFGLGSSAWTRDPAEQRAFIDGIQSGQVFLNAMCASDPRLPFGGVKHSGYGRELARYGIREFVNIKTVVIA